MDTENKPLQFADTTLYPKHTDHLTAIGLVIVQFSVLEQSINDCIKDMLDLSPADVNIICAQFRGFGTLDELFQALFKERFADNSTAMEKFKETTAIVKYCTNERNLIAHSTWGTLETGEVVRFRTEGYRDHNRRKYASKYKTVTVDDLKDLAAKINDAYTAVQSLHCEFLAPLNDE